jgi:hypothetical protein
VTDARYGAFNETIGNNNANPIFQGLDPRAISNAIGTQEAETAQSTQANIFFMSFGQYFDHGLSFIPKGGNGTIEIGGPGMGRAPGTDNPADLTRASVTGFENGVPQHTNITSPFVDQNQVYGSSKQVGQLLRESDGNGGVGAKVLMGEIDPSAPQFSLLPTLRAALDHHIEAGTVFSSSDRGDMTLLEYYPTLKNADGQYDAATVKLLVANFMGEGWPLLLDTNPFIDLLDHIVSGDGRVNENVTLTSMHTIFTRNHNYHVETLRGIYEQQGIAISKEELFQAAKIVNEAEYQRVVFTEFAEKLLGGEGIRGDGAHGFKDYAPETDARISHEFAGAAYRVGHTMIGQTITVLDVDGNPKQVSLFDAFLNPTNETDAFAFDPDGAGPAPTITGADAVGALAERGYVPQPGYEQLGVASILGGIVGQPSEEVDVNIVDAVRNDLVRISADLFAFNVARGWDLGLGTLNQIRMDVSKSTNGYIQEAVGYTGELTPYTSWEDFQARNSLSDAVIAQFREAYPDLVLAAGDIASFQAVNPDIGLIMNQDGSATVKGIDRVDFWVGGLAESKFEGAMVGSTFWVILHEQFDRLQEGDRFYYIPRLENQDLYANFVEGQSFADIVMRNTGLQGLDERIFEVSNEDNGGVTLPTVDAPVVDAPVVDAPVVDAPVVDAPVVDAPVVDAPVVDAPVVDAPVVDAPVVDTPVVDTPTPADPTPVAPRAAIRGTIEADMLMAQANVASFMDALGGDDIVFGSDSLDIIFGGDGADKLFAGEGNDQTFGGNGDDYIFAEDGQDVVTGGAGSDWIFGGDGADKLFAGEGNDQTFGGNGDDYIFAEDGQDVVTGGAGSDWIFGGAGDDRLLATVGDADDAYYGDEGIDTLDMSAISANATVDLGSTSFGNGSAVSDQTGNDVLSSIENVITGSGADKIYANDAVNMINAGAGNDTILFGSAASADGDMIFGFETGDLICLQQMDANLGVSGLQGFTLVAGQSFSDAGQLMIRHEMRDGGEVSIIEGNIGGDFQADFRIEISGVLVQESNLLL